MAQEFKVFDKRFKKSKGKALEHIRQSGKAVTQADIDSIEGWPHVEHFREDYTAAQIRDAVYVYADMWQEFRVSMKGLNTREKLYALLDWWAYMVDGLPNMPLRDINIIRVNNYLGALKRGGFLDNNLRIIKL